MSAEHEKLLEQYFQIWNTQDSALAQQVISPAFVSRFGDTGPEGFIDTVARRHAAFENAHFEITEIFPVCPGDYIVWFAFSGVYSGKALPKEALGKPVDVVGVAFYRVRDDKVTGIGLSFDEENRLPNQLGVPIPEDRNGEF